VVSFEGGDICPAITGYPGSSELGKCAGNVLNVRIDATTGAWLDTYADGNAITQEQASSSPPPSVEELLLGHT
jgi:hypothetical protein